jgi:outer membrane protein
MASSTQLAAIGAAFLVTIAAATAPAFAGDSNGNLQIRLGVTGVVFDDNVKSVTATGGSVDLKSAIGADAKIGNTVVPTATVTYFFTPNWAIEAICCTAHISAKGAGGLAPLGDIADAWVLPPIITLQYRFDRINGFQPYVGAGGQWIHYWAGKGDNALGAGTVDIDDSFGFALQTGIDYDLGQGWSLNLDVKKTWLDTTVKWKDVPGLHDVRAEVDLDPWWFTASLGYRFNVEDLFHRQAAAPLK